MLSQNISLICYKAVIYKTFQARDKQLLTPLHLACSYEKTDVAKILLEAGAIIRCTGEKLQTPLHKVNFD